MNILANDDFSVIIYTKNYPFTITSIANELKGEGWDILAIVSEICLYGNKNTGEIMYLLNKEPKQYNIKERFIGNFSDAVQENIEIYNDGSSKKSLILKINVCDTCNKLIDGDKSKCTPCFKKLMRSCPKRICNTCNKLEIPNLQSNIHQTQCYSCYKNSK